MAEIVKKKLDLRRRSMPKQMPEVRRHNFKEVALGYTEKSAVEFVVVNSIFKSSSRIDEPE